MKKFSMLLAAVLGASAAFAENSTLDAAIGGGIGGAAGAAIGNELGGRDGAVIGGAAGAALGVAVNTDEERRHEHSAHPPRYEYSAPAGNLPRYRFCPPGQAKKGRC